MAFESSKNINTEAILFETAFETAFAIPNARFVKDESPDQDSAYSIQQEGEVVATGGFVWNYNYPYIDIYYEVKESSRKKGYGTLIAQELKKEAYRLGRIPAAGATLTTRHRKQPCSKRECGFVDTWLLGTPYHKTEWLNNKV